MPGGRGRGEGGPLVRPSHWLGQHDPIAQWTARHDEVVALAIAGYEIKSIAAIVDYSEPNVKKVLKEPRAVKALQLARTRMIGSAMIEVKDRMAALGTHALKNIEDTVMADVRDDKGRLNIGGRAKMHQDSVSFELLSRLGYTGKGNGNGDRPEGSLRLSPEAEERFITALEKANRAEILFKQSEKVEAEVIEGGKDGDEAATPTSRE